MAHGTTHNTGFIIAFWMAIWAIKWASKICMAIMKHHMYSYNVGTAIVLKAKYL